MSDPTKETIDWEKFSAELSDARRVLDRIAINLALLTPASLAVQTTSQKKQLVRVITSLVAQKYEITLERLCSRVRTDELAWPRQVAMALSREFTSLPSTAIGQLFDRDHGTVLHAIEHVEARCSVNAHLREDVEHLRAAIKQKIIGGEPNPDTK